MDTTQKKRSFSWSRMFSFVFIMLLILTGGWAGYRAFNLYHHMAYRVDQTKSQVQQTRSDLDEQNALVQSNLKTLAQINATLNAQTVDLIEQEVNYLLKIADDTLRFKQDVPTTLNILQTVSLRLATLTNPKWSPFKENLKATIQTLQKVPAVSIQNLYEQVTDIQNRLNQLQPIPTKLDLPEATKKQTETSNTRSLFKKALMQTLRALQSMLIIRHHNEAVEPILSVQEQGALTLNLQILLAQAKWALLQHNETIYNNSLTQASTWIDRYFVGSDPATQKILKDLNVLQKINIAPNKPNNLADLIALVPQETQGGSE